MSCCWVCWSLQITFLCGPCWFYVVRHGYGLLSYLAFSLLCSPCCLLFQNKYADNLSLAASALCSPSTAANICTASGWEPWDVSSHTMRCRMGSHRVRNQHTTAGAVGFEHLVRDSLVFRTTVGQRGQKDMALGVYVWYAKPSAAFWHYLYFEASAFQNSTLCAYTSVFLWVGNMSGHVGVQWGVYCLCDIYWGEWGTLSWVFYHCTLNLLRIQALPLHSRPTPDGARKMLKMNGGFRPFYTVLFLIGRK